MCTLKKILCHSGQKQTLFQRSSDHAKSAGQRNYGLAYRFFNDSEPFKTYFLIQNIEKKLHVKKILKKIFYYKVFDKN